MLPLQLGAQYLLYTLTDGLGCGDMTGSLQDHCLKDDEQLGVPQSVPHPLELRPHHPDKPAPESPTRRVIAPRWHDH